MANIEALSVDESYYFNDQYWEGDKKGEEDQGYWYPENKECKDGDIDGSYILCELGY